MEFEINENGEKVVTHVRCVNAEGKHRPIALVVATNHVLMETVIGYTIEDPEYDEFLRNQEVAVKEPEIKEEVETVEDEEKETERPAIEEIEEVKKEVKKPGRKPKK